MGSLWIQAYRLNPSKPSSQESRGFNHGSVKLISPSEFAMAERTWDGDTWHMAAELDVTMQVLADYRQILKDGLFAKRP